MADIEVSCAVLDRTGTEVRVYTSEGTPALTTADRYLVKNNGKMSVFVEAGATVTTVSVEIPQTLDDQPVEPRRIPVGPNEVMGIGHWPPNIYNNARSELALTFSSVDGVKLFCSCLS